MPSRHRPKQKSLPEDFCVEELSEFAADGGPFALYRLTKRGLGTPEAVEAILRRWKLGRRQLAWGGLKDRHALTVQWLTIHGGPRRNLHQTNLELAYQGQAPRPFTSADITGNRFRIVLRDLRADEISAQARAVAAVQRDGVPNYFDQQRFGSLGQSGQFVARAWCEGNHEQAVRLFLTDPNPHDRPEQRVQRKVIQEHWGDWQRLVGLVRYRPWREILAHLAQRPGDFRVASERIPPDLRSLMVAAFQSFLWNQILASLLREHCPAEQLTDASIAGQTLPFFRELAAAEHALLAGGTLPLPSARLRLEEGPIQERVDRVLGSLGLNLRQLRMKYPRRTFFSLGDRAALVTPSQLSHSVADDELHSGRQKMSLEFTLPRGSYATIVLKRLTID